MELPMPRLASRVNPPVLSARWEPYWADEVSWEK